MIEAALKMDAASRIPGGFQVVNYLRYREKDHTPSVSQLGNGP